MSFFSEFGLSGICFEFINFRPGRDFINGRGLLIQGGDYYYYYHYFIIMIMIIVIMIVVIMISIIIIIIMAYLYVYVYDNR